MITYLQVFRKLTLKVLIAAPNLKIGRAFDFFSNWHPGEPNNQGGQDCARVGLLPYTSSKIEDFPMKHYGNYQFLWDDISCDHELPFACEGNFYIFFNLNVFMSTMKIFQR